MSALTSILSRDRAVSVRKIEEALQRQVVAGGALETALLEVSALPENVLAAYRAALFGLLPATRSDLMGAAHEVVALVPREVAARHRIVPLRTEGRILVVAAATPLPPEDDEALGGLLGHDVVYRIVPEVRLELALGAHYGVPVSGRAARLGDRLAREDPGQPPYVAPPPRGAVATGHAGGPSPRRAPEPPPATPRGATSPRADDHDDRPIAGTEGIGAPPRPNPFPADDPRGGTREVAVPPPPGHELDRTLVDAPAPTRHRPPDAPRGRLPTGTILRADLALLDDGTTTPEADGADEPDPAARPADTDPSPPPDFTVAPPADEADAGVGPTASSSSGETGREDTAEYGTVRRAPGWRPAPREDRSERPAPARSRSSSGIGSPAAPFRPSRHPTSRPEDEPEPVPPPAAAAAHLPSSAPRTPPDPPPEPAPRPLLDGPHAPPRWRRRRGPLPYDEAAALLADAASRDAILAVFFGYARQFFDHTVLFVVHEGQLVVQDASAGADDVRGQRLPAPAGSAARSVLDSGAPATVDLRAQPADQELAVAIGRREQQPAVLLPVAIRGRAVIVLYGDQDGDRVRLGELSQLLAVLPRVAEAFERLILERKTRRAAPSAAPPPDPVEGDDQEATAPRPRPSGTAPERSPSTDELRSQLGVPRRPPSPPEAAEPPVGRPRDQAGGAYHVRPGERRHQGEVERVGTGDTPGRAPRAPSVPPPDEPSVIVDMGDQLEALVRNLVTFGPEDTREPIDALLRQGEAALPVLIARFPGPLWFDRRQPYRRLPRGRDVSAVARAIVGFRERAAPYLASAVAAGDADRRFYAVLVSSEVVDPRLLPALRDRIFDEDPGVRELALRVLDLYRRHPAELAEALHPVRGEARAPRKGGRLRRLWAVRALGWLRDRRALGVLLALLEEDDAELRGMARESLVLLTRQDFGDAPRRWMSWAEKQEGRHRVEWLIDALLHPDEAMRSAAGEELQQLTQQYLGYHPSLPKRDREIAQGKYRAWWESEGRDRFGD